MLHDETILTFSEAAARLPLVNGKRPHASTVWRWARKGIGVQGIKLEALKLGGRFVTSFEALERFGRALAAADTLPTVIAEKTPRPDRCRPDARREMDIARAEAEVEAVGV